MYLYYVSAQIHNVWTTATLEDVSYLVGTLLIKMERVSKRAIRISGNRPQEITIVVVFYLRVSDAVITSHEESTNGKSLSEIYLFRDSQ